MVVIKFDKRVIAKVPNAVERIRENLLENIIFYMIDRKYRTVVNLQKWVGEQLDAAREHEGMLEVAKGLKTNNHDLTALNCLRWVHDNTTYVTDDKKWKMTEKWEDVINVFDTQEGDCESGALLMYVLCRLAEVPENRLWIQCGEVNGGGHAWLSYIPEEYPLNFVYLDWCYWYKKYSVPIRNKFTVSGTNILEYKKSGAGYAEEESNYYKLWFAFNEEKSYRKFR